MTDIMASPPSASRKEYLETCPVVAPPSTDHVCPICYEDWNAESEAVIRTHCAHVFHRECLTAWFGEENVESANTCPSCRSECFPGTPKDTGVVIVGERTRNLDDISFLYQTMYPTSRPKRLRRSFDKLSTGSLSASLRHSIAAPFRRSAGNRNE